MSGTKFNFVGTQYPNVYEILYIIHRKMLFIHLFERFSFWIYRSQLFHFLISLYFICRFCSVHFRHHRISWNTYILKWMGKYSNFNAKMSIFLWFYSSYIERRCQHKPNVSNIRYFIVSEVAWRRLFLCLIPFVSFRAYIINSWTDRIIYFIFFIWIKFLWSFASANFCDRW